MSPTVLVWVGLSTSESHPLQSYRLTAFVGTLLVPDPVLSRNKCREVHLWLSIFPDLSNHIYYFSLGQSEK